MSSGARGFGAASSVKRVARPNRRRQKGMFMRCCFDQIRAGAVVLEIKFRGLARSQAAVFRDLLGICEKGNNISEHWFC